MADTSLDRVNDKGFAGADGLSADRLSRGVLIRRRFFRNKLATFGLCVVVFMCCKRLRKNSNVVPSNPAEYSPWVKNTVVPTVSLNLIPSLA